MDTAYYSNFENLDFRTGGLDTAVEVKDYPYGSLRTSMFYFVEYRERKGWRPVTQSLNPKTGKMNKSHPGTYSLLPIFIGTAKDTGYIQFIHFPTHGGNRGDEWQHFINAFWNDLPQTYKNIIKAFVTVIIMRSPEYYKDVNIVFPEAVTK